MLDTGVELQRKVEEVLIENVISGLTTPVRNARKLIEPDPRDIIFKGILDEVQDFFYKNMWNEGLPILPPTLRRVEGFLRFTDRSPEEVIGVLLPENREATIWNVAVNGVMAGCRPEYMPVLIAIVEAIADPEFRIEDGGGTPGWEPLIQVNGPIIKELDFNYGSGSLRTGRQPNTSIGRFLRLYLRNVAGLRIPPGATDKGSIAYTFNVTLAENEDAVREIGWQPFSVDRGFAPQENVVTVQSCISITPCCYTAGTEPLEHLETIANVIGQAMAYRTATAVRENKFFPLFVFAPAVARVIANGGWTKDDVKEYLYNEVKVSAGLLEKLAWQAGQTNFDFCRHVAEGLIPKTYCDSPEPERQVPVFLRPEWIGIVVAGDEGANETRGYVQNQKQGAPVSKRVVLPDNWTQLRGQI